jgi:hypothetical protein
MSIAQANRIAALERTVDELLRQVQELLQRVAALEQPRRTRRSHQDEP